MIYWDNNSTSPLRPRVKQRYIEAIERYAANPNSTHKLGQEVRSVLEQTRRKVAEVFHCQPGELVFTASATESNLIALWSLWCERNAKGACRVKIIASPLEHSSVHEDLQLLCENCKAEVIQLNLTADGQVDLAQLRKLLETSADEIAFCTTIAAHNETGLLQPWKEMAALCKEFKVPFHTDFVQAVGRYPINLAESNVSLATLSFHKVGGPKGVALLYVRPGLEFHPLIRGGGQELKRRSGTENVPVIASIGALVEEYDEMVGDFQGRIRKIRDDFEVKLKAAIPGITIVGENSERLPNTTYAIFPDVRSDAMLMGLDMAGVCASSGSACSSGMVIPSRALLKLGYSANQAINAIRFSLGMMNSLEEVPQVIDAVRTVQGRMAQKNGTRN